MTIAVTGASGLLGSAIVQHAQSAGHRVQPIDRALLWNPSARSICDALAARDVSCLVHCAANTNVEECEKDPAAAYRDNALLTETLATVSVRLNVPLVYISSTGVYGGAKSEPYTEFDLPEPTTHHHRSKLLGEHAVESVNGLILRTGWLFGGRIDNPKNFVANRVREALKSNGAISSNQDQRGVPTSVTDVADRLFALMDAGRIGVFNCTNAGSASRYEYVREIIRSAGLDVEVKPVSAKGFARVAPVSNNEMAINRKMELLGFGPMRDWKEALRSYVESIAPKLIK